MRYKLYILLLYILVTGCSRTEQNIEAIEIIPIDHTKTKIDRVGQLFEMGNCIPLETNEESLIGKISKFSIHGDFIVILDQDIVNKVFVFDINGNFIYNSGKNGKGPLELIYPSDYCVMGEYLYIIDEAQKKIVKYELSTGEPKQEYFIDFWGYQLSPLENDSFVFFDAFKEEVVITDNKFREINRFHNTSWFHFNSAFKPFETIGGEVLYTSALCDTIFTISTHDFQPKFIIDFGDYRISEKHVLQCNDQTELMTLASVKQLCRWVDRLHKWGNSISFTFTGTHKQMDTGFFCIVDLLTKKSTITTFKIKDDILNLPFPPLFQFVDSTGFYFWYDQHEIENYTKSNFPLLSQNSNPIIFNYKLLNHEKN